MKVVSIPTFIAPQLITAKILDQHRLSIGDWIKKVNTHNMKYSAIETILCCLLQQNGCKKRLP